MRLYIQKGLISFYNKPSHFIQKHNNQIWPHQLTRTLCRRRLPIPRLILPIGLRAVRVRQRLPRLVQLAPHHLHPLHPRQPVPERLTLHQQLLQLGHALGPALTLQALQLAVYVRGQQLLAARAGGVGGRALRLREEAGRLELASSLSEDRGALVAHFHGSPGKVGCNEGSSGERAVLPVEDGVFVVVCEAIRDHQVEVFL